VCRDGFDADEEAAKVEADAASASAAASLSPSRQLAKQVDATGLKTEELLASIDEVCL
jgi:hypothetical protein